MKTIGRKVGKRRYYNKFLSERLVIRDGQDAGFTLEREIQE